MLHAPEDLLEDKVDSRRESAFFATLIIASIVSTKLSSRLALPLLVLFILIGPAWRIGDWALRNIVG